MTNDDLVDRCNAFRAKTDGCVVTLLWMSLGACLALGYFVWPVSGWWGVLLTVVGVLFCHAIFCVHNYLRTLDRDVVEAEDSRLPDNIRKYRVFAQPGATVRDVLRKRGVPQLGDPWPERGTRCVEVTAQPLTPSGRLWTVQCQYEDPNGERGNV